MFGGALYYGGTDPDVYTRINISIGIGGSMYNNIIIVFIVQCNIIASVSCFMSLGLNRVVLLFLL